MVQLLPSYSPNLAPAELVFALTKRKLLFKKESNEINFGRSSEKISIIESLRAVDSLWCRKIWGRIWQEYLSVMIRVLENKSARNSIVEVVEIEEKRHKDEQI